MELNYEKDLEINKFALDKECITQSKLYFNYADAAQQAKDALSKAKDNLELVLATRGIGIRQEYESAGKKYTEKVIESELAMDKEVVEAKEVLRECESIYGKISAAVKAMEIRGNQLDNLVKLYGSQYFSVNKDYSNEIRKNLNDKK